MKEKLRVAFQVACLVAVVAMMMSFAPVSVSAGEEILPTTDYCTQVCKFWGDSPCGNGKYVVCR